MTVLSKSVPRQQELWDVTRIWWIAFAVVTALRVAVAARFPLQGDEAYYWMWSRHLAMGYYDHPPLIAWGIRFGTLLLGRCPLGVRLTTLMGGTLATWGVWALGCRMGGQQVGARAGLAALAFPYFSYVSFTAFPDGLMLGFAACGLLLAWQRRWASCGVALGMSALAKLPVGLLGISTVLWRRRNLRPLVPWLATGLATISPFLFWNATHHWITFAFQFAARQAREGHFRPLGPLAYAAVQAAAGSPVLWAALWAAVVWAMLQKTEAGSFVGLQALVTLGVFGLVSFQHRIQPHWPLIGYLTAFVALGLACDGTHAKRFRRAWKYGVVSGFGLLALAFGMLLSPGALFWLAGRPGGSSVTAPFGMAAFGPMLARRSPGDFLLAENHGVAASLEFYSHRRVHWYSRNLHGREYLQWEDYRALKGRNALFIDVHPMSARPDVRSMLAHAFHAIGATRRVLVRWHGHPARAFYLTELKGFRGHGPPGGIAQIFGRARGINGPDWRLIGGRPPAARPAVGGGAGPTHGAASPSPRPVSAPRPPRLRQQPGWQPGYAEDPTPARWSLRPASGSGIGAGPPTGYGPAPPALPRFGERKRGRPRGVAPAG